MDDRSTTQSEPAVDRSTRSPRTLIAVVVGVVGVVAALIPPAFFIGWLCGAAAIALAVPTIRAGRSDPGSGMARLAVGTGIAAIVLGVLNLGITLDWFTFFTTDDAARAL